MVEVGRIGGAGRIAPARVRAATGGFRTAEPVAPAATEAVSAPHELSGLLAMQEAEADWVRDRPARRHAQSMLDELAALQRRLLAGDAEPGTLRRLASLARTCPEAANPHLSGVLRAVALRAAVELARQD